MAPLMVQVDAATTADKAALRILIMRYRQQAEAAVAERHNAATQVAQAVAAEMHVMVITTAATQFQVKGNTAAKTVNHGAAAEAAAQDNRASLVRVVQLAAAD